MGAEKKRHEAKDEAQVTRVVAIVAGDAKARAEDDLSRVQEALVVAKEVRRKAKAETVRLEVERTSPLLGLGEPNDEVSSLYSQMGKDKEAMEEDY